MITRRSLLLYASLAATVAASIWTGAIEGMDEPSPAPRASRVALADGALRSSAVSTDTSGGSPVSSALRAAARSEQANGYRLPHRPTPNGDAGSAGDVFAAYSWAPPPPPATVDTTRTATITPPVPFTYTGQMQTEGTTRYLLAEGLRTHIVTVGDEVGEFRLESADAGALVFLHDPTSGRQVLTITQ